MLCQSMKATFVEPGRSTNAYRIGFRYAIRFHSRPPNWYKIIDAVKSQLGEPNYKFQYYGIGGVQGGLRLKPGIKSSRWMATTQNWSANNFDNRAPQWLLFREEKHRTLASMIIGDYL